MSKNSKIVSVSIRPEQHDALRKAGKVSQKGISELVRDLIDEHLNDESLILDDQAKKLVDAVAQNKACSSSDILSDLANRYLVGDGHIPVVLKVPKELKGDRKGLAEWLQSRARAVLEKLS